MPDVKQITIANSNPNPNGTGLPMSKSGSGNLPNQATWRSDSKAYTIGLPTSVWNVSAAGDTYSFSLPANSTSDVYTLRPDAPDGLQSYSISGAPGLEGDNPIPQVDVEP